MLYYSIPIVISARKFLLERETFRAGVLGWMIDIVVFSVVMEGAYIPRGFVNMLLSY